MAEFFDRTAAVGSDEEEEEFDDETGEATGRPRTSKATNGGLEDDSSEEEDDDNEEAEREVAEGFIDDDDEEDEAKRERRRERKKRRREEREEDLDEEDLDLINGDRRPDPPPSKFKRLKRGHREDRSTSQARGVEDIFSDDEDGADPASAVRGRGAFGYGDEMDDFIEQDEFPDEEGGQLDDDLGVRPPKRPGLADLQNMKDSGMDEADMEDMRGAFGDGNEYSWALTTEKQNDLEALDPEKPLELKDVFEPSQLIEKMLTDEDNAIRMTDVPERFQLARQPYKSLDDLTEQEMAERDTEEANWVANVLFPKKQMPGDLREPFENAIRTVLRFMNVEDYEPAFIFNNRKDYLIHSEQVPTSPNPDDPNGPEFRIKAEKLLNQADLWDVFEQDLKYRAFEERRHALKRIVQTLGDSIPDFSDVVLDEMVPLATGMEDLQDLQDYINFQYSAQLQDIRAAQAQANGTQKRAGGTNSHWDRVRSAPAYHLVRAFGITADQFARNAAKTGPRTYTDDSDLRPDDMADTLLRDPDYRTGKDVMDGAKAMFVEEIATSPRLRRHLRGIYYEQLVFDVHRTEKGLKAIDEEHTYYDIKYLRNQRIREIVLDRPEIFLRMLKAESEGLIEVHMRLQDEKRLRTGLEKAIESDNFSEVADAWNAFRREALLTALDKLHKIIAKGVKDNVKNELEHKLASYCREAYTSKLDQAPLRPKGMVNGTKPRVLALSNGGGNREDAICWAYIEEGGRTLENGKFTDLKSGDPERHQPDGVDIAPLCDLVARRKPDVIAVSGWSAATRKLYDDLRRIVDERSLEGTPYTDEDDHEVTDPLEVVMANDEVARLYYNTDRAVSDHPGLAPLTRYAIALARYMQEPIKEYAALGKSITSIFFDANQTLVPEEKLLRYLETAMVDTVNLVGVNLNNVTNDPYSANLLPYICGLGPRKAAHMIKVINQNGGEIGSREELVGDVDAGKRQAVGPKVWTNCASFVYIEYEEGDPQSDYLDNTRIHPEDYDIARKMAADAQDMDEEDIKVETDESGPMAVVRKLIKEDAQDKVNDLMLEQYAEQLETQFSQKKRATLETIRLELQNPYEELRNAFTFLSTEEIFTMLTGETRDSLTEGMIVPVNVRRTNATHVDVTLDCGIEGGIGEGEYPDDVNANGIQARSVWAMGQTIRAKITRIDRKKLTAQLTLRDIEMRKPYVRPMDHGLDEWDEELETRDRKEAKKIQDASGATRAQRVIKHPLFRPFKSQEAQNFLMSQNRGDCVIRPSSKGPDHLAVTWKVHTQLYQHLDVLELDKENEFSVGRTLRVGGKYNYSDLDELIALHVRAMAKKVDEMMGDERYQNGTKDQTEAWLTTYTEANPKRSMYAFCLNKDAPGYFHMCFKAGPSAPHASWPVKVIPNAFELRGHKYPDMRALKNGFKVLMGNGALSRR